VDFIEKLANAARKNRSLLCVGLDPNLDLMPKKVDVFEINKSIIEATSALE